MLQIACKNFPYFVVYAFQRCTIERQNGHKPKCLHMISHAIFLGFYQYIDGQMARMGIAPRFHRHQGFLKCGVMRIEVYIRNVEYLEAGLLHFQFFGSRFFCPNDVALGSKIAASLWVVVDVYFQPANAIGFKLLVEWKMDILQLLGRTWILAIE
jgi:hypothetical protein